ncbi:unnamed protein product [Larinioides sclopetarius]|uniref:Uncharacterized protein n=1 Tax=Larinioides sclopetarius TaxID=280406 RepID=A0AAV2C2G4_9ARAC
MKPESNEVWKGHDLHIISLSLESCLILNGDSSDCRSSATQVVLQLQPSTAASYLILNYLLIVVIQLPVNFTLSMVTVIFKIIWALSRSESKFIPFWSRTLKDNTRLCGLIDYF